VRKRAVKEPVKIEAQQSHRHVECEDEPSGSILKENMSPDICFFAVAKCEEQEDGEGRQPVENTECPFEDSRKRGHGLQSTDENIIIGTYVGAQHQNENN